MRTCTKGTLVYDFMTTVKKCRLIVLTGFLLLMAIGAQAQISFGGKAAIKWTNYRTSELPTISQDKGDIAYYIRGFARFGKRWYFEPYLGVSSYGGEVSVQDDTNKDDFKLRLNSIDAGGYFGYRFFYDSPVMLRVYGGPLFNFYTKRDIDYVTPVRVTSGPVTDEDFRTTNIAMSVGAGLNFSIFTFDLEFETGITDILESPIGKDGAVRTNSFNFVLGVELSQED